MRNLADIRELLMKETIITLLLCLLLFPLYAQNSHREIPGIQPLPEYETTRSSPYHFQHSLKAQANDWDSLRALSEINVLFLADAYPWISPDGLHLYYTRRVGIDDKIYMASRATTSDLFNSPVSLNINTPGGNAVSPWLTNDELTIYWSSEGGSGFVPKVIQYATRAAISDTFGVPVTLTLIGNMGLPYYGVSLTQDLSTLYMFGFGSNSANDTEVFILEETGQDTFSLMDSLPLPPGAIMSEPGQLSKDDLKFYTGVADGVNPAVLGYFSRSSPADPFGNFTLLSGNINTTGAKVSQPTVNGSEDLIIMVRSVSNTWNDNELYLAQCVDSLTGQFDLLPAMEEISAHAFPNPANDQVTIKFAAHPGSRPYSIRLTNMMGKEMQRWPLSPSDHSISLNVSDLPSGLYTYRFQLPGGAEKIGKIVISR